MWWIPLASAALQAINNNQKRKDTEAYNLGQAEVTRYSPWTGVHGQSKQQEAPSTAASLAGGYIQGMGIQQGLEKGLGNASGSEFSGAAPSVPQGPYSLGAGDMINTDYNTAGGPGMSQDFKSKWSAFSQQKPTMYAGGSPSPWSLLK